jgi:hypothetical protein
MKSPNTIVVLDDVKEIVDALIEGMKSLPELEHLNIEGFNKDDSAKKYVLKSRESVLGYIQDINRPPMGPVDPGDRAGVRFFNEV